MGDFLKSARPRNPKVRIELPFFIPHDSEYAVLSTSEAWNDKIARIRLEGEVVLEIHSDGTLVVPEASTRDHPWATEGLSAQEARINMAFNDLTVGQRNRAWKRIEELEKRIERLSQELEERSG